MKKPSLLIVLFLLSLVSCRQEPVQKRILVEEEPVRFLALGDSYTIGTSVEQLHNWPNQLADSLSRKGFPVDTTFVLATNGWTTTDLKQGIQTARPDSNFNLVSLLIGVNNQYQGMDIEIYRTEFRELLESAIAFAGQDTSNVFVVSIPNYGVTPFAASRNPDVIRQELLEYDRIAKSIATEYGIPFINITPVSELADENLSLLAEDELHPSAEMYAMWIPEMLPVVKERLSE